jgi:hypothetical protein
MPLTYPQLEEHLCAKHHHPRYIEKKNTKKRDFKGMPKTLMPPIRNHFEIHSAFNVLANQLSHEWVD